MAETSDILTRLLERTDEDKVIWQTTVEDNEFLVVLGKLSVTIRQYEFQGMQNVLRILNEEGTEIEMLGTSTNEGAPWYAELSDLYRKARRIALGVDSQLEDLLKVLESD